VFQVAPVLELNRNLFYCVRIELVLIILALYCGQYLHSRNILASSVTTFYKRNFN